MSLIFLLKEKYVIYNSSYLSYFVFHRYEIKEASIAFPIRIFRKLILDVFKVLH